MKRFFPRAALLFAVFFVYLAPVAVQAQEQVQMMLQMLGPRFIVFRDKVQDELNLTGDQRGKLNSRVDSIVQEAHEFFQSIQDVKPDERPKKHAEYAQKATEKLDNVLKDTLTQDQLKRVKQIGLQMEGLFAIGHPDVSKELNITDDQRRQFMTIVQELQSKMEPVFKQAQEGGDPQEVRPKIMKIRKDHEVKLEAMLTDAQKKQWKEMVGKPFDLGD